MRATDVLISGKRALVCGYGDVGKGSVGPLIAQAAKVSVTEIDPICALQACMDGMDVITVEDALEKGFDIYVHGNGQQRHHHCRPHEAHEGQSHRLQHRSLR